MTSPPSGDRVPTQLELLNPTLRALRSLGGSASIGEIAIQVIRDLSLPSDVTEIPHGGDSRTELEYRLAWARTQLKRYGSIDNSQRGIWSLTERGQRVAEVVPSDVGEWVSRNYRKEGGTQSIVDVSHEGDEPTEEEQKWKDELLEVLKQMHPAAFERLGQRMLREAGFIEVAVTGRSGDGGIDGHGVMRLNGLISFPVLFQCKRYNGKVAANVVRDFRGAMQGRADKGLIITTGGFTADAFREATRDGAPPIDLISGDLLAEKLKELRLGVTVDTKTIEVVTVNQAFFGTV